MTKKLYEKMGTGGEIPHQGVVKEVMNQYDNRTMKNQAGHIVNCPKEALMDAFNQACKSKKRLLNENGKKGMDMPTLPDTIFRNF